MISDPRYNFRSGVARKAVTKINVISVFMSTKMEVLDTSLLLNMLSEKINVA